MKKKFALSWRQAAAVFLLVATGVCIMLASRSEEAGPGIQVAETTANPTENAVPATAEANEATANNDTDPGTPDTQDTAIANNPIKPGNSKGLALNKNITQQFNEVHRTKEFVCNGTPCPLEICIIQTIHCQNKKPAAIATCNTLEPDQARQLRYKAPDGAGAHCKVTIDEIRIRRVTTGETIVLNAHSKPSTAEELFNCITGSEKCDLLAGIFEADCNNQQTTHGLKIDNNFGNLIMQ